VFDGVPRTMDQARAGHKIAMELGMSANAAVQLRAGDTELTRRLLARAVKTEAQYDDGDAGWVRVGLDGYDSGELVYLTPENARDLAAHLTAAATIAGSPVTRTPQT
jgi:adenylate kinase family enzyme